MSKNIFYTIFNANFSFLYSHLVGAPRLLILSFRMYANDNLNFYDKYSRGWRESKFRGKKEDYDTFSLFYLREKAQQKC